MRPPRRTVSHFLSGGRLQGKWRQDLRLKGPKGHTVQKLSLELPVVASRSFAVFGTVQCFVSRGLCAVTLKQASSHRSMVSSWTSAWGEWMPSCQTPCWVMLRQPELSSSVLRSFISDLNCSNLILGESLRRERCVPLRVRLRPRQPSSPTRRSRWQRAKGRVSRNAKPTEHLVTEAFQRHLGVSSWLQVASACFRSTLRKSMQHRTASP